MCVELQLQIAVTRFLCEFVIGLQQKTLSAIRKLLSFSYIYPFLMSPFISHPSHMAHLILVTLCHGWDSHLHTLLHPSNHSSRFQNHFASSLSLMRCPLRRKEKITSKCRVILEGGWFPPPCNIKDLCQKQKQRALVVIMALAADEAERKLSIWLWTFALPPYSCTPNM